MIKRLPAIPNPVAHTVFTTAIGWLRLVDDLELDHRHPIPYSMSKVRLVHLRMPPRDRPTPAWVALILGVLIVVLVSSLPVVGG